MKALELAKLFEIESDAESLYRQAAAELRRLAEVNALMEEALMAADEVLEMENYEKAGAVRTAITEALAKAKEKQ